MNDSVRLSPANQTHSMPQKGLSRGLANTVHAPRANATFHSAQELAAESWDGKAAQKEDLAQPHPRRLVAVQTNLVPAHLYRTTRSRTLPSRHIRLQRLFCNCMLYRCSCSICCYMTEHLGGLLLVALVVERTICHRGLHCPRRCFLCMGAFRRELSQDC